MRHVSRWALATRMPTGEDGAEQSLSECLLSGGLFAEPPVDGKSCLDDSQTAQSHLSKWNSRQDEGAQ